MANVNFDTILHGGTIYDGSGKKSFQGDIAISNDRIAAIGNLQNAKARKNIRAEGLAIAPGFINMLSWAVESLIVDGRSQSDIRQGVTLEVMGEGFSFGPFSEAMVQAGIKGILGNKDIQYEITWRSLGEYLSYLETRGVSTNITSFVGTSTLRKYVIGDDDRPPSPFEIEHMVSLVREAMQEGAVGLSSALIYPPASYANTDELIALAKAAAEFKGMYISHIRSEGDFFLEALDEFINIVAESKARGEIYHIKAVGEENFEKFDQAVTRIETARNEGIPITANVYPYNASGTGLKTLIPPWAHDGGTKALLTRLQDPLSREKIRNAMNTASTAWENRWNGTSPEAILLAGFGNPKLKPLTGKNLAEIAALRGTSLEDTIFDLLIEDDGEIFTIYFTQAEDNVRKAIQLPWVSFCSDAESLAPEGVFLKSNPHPRAYGSFARVLGKYVRDEGLISIEESIRRLTSLPAGNLKIQERGLLKVNNYADIVLFDPAQIHDNATYVQPHQYASGMVHVFVNGTQVLAEGEHTGMTPGRFVRGPGYRKPK